MAVRAVGLVGENCDARLAARAARVGGESVGDGRHGSDIRQRRRLLVVCAVLVRRSGPTHLLKGCDDDARARAAARIAEHLLQVRALLGADHLRRLAVAVAAHAFQVAGHNVAQLVVEDLAV